MDYRGWRMDYRIARSICCGVAYELVYDVKAEKYMLICMWCGRESTLGLTITGPKPLMTEEERLSYLEANR